MRQRLPEFAACAVDIGLHGAQWEVEHRGDFFIGPALDVPEQNAGSILRPEGGYGLLDFAPEFLRLELLEGGFLAVAELKRAGLDRLWGQGVRGAVEGEGVQLPAPQVVDGDVVGDLEDPARELVLGTVRFDRVERLDEGLLGEILRLLAKSRD